MIGALRGKLSTGAVVLMATALGLGFVFACHRGVHVDSTHQGLEIYDARYFAAGHFHVLFARTIEKVKLQCRLALEKFGVPFSPVNGYSISADGPMLLIYGHIREGSSPRLDFVTGSGQLIAPWGKSPVHFLFDSQTNTYLWCVDLSEDRGLTNGLYHVRECGKTNILADVRVRM